MNRKLNQFYKNKRATYSLLILAFSYIVSLFAPFLANNKPILVSYNSKIYFPIFYFYSEKNFGLKNDTEPNYKKLAQHKMFKKDKNFMIFPVIRYGSNEDNLENLAEGERPPSKPSLNHLLGTDDRGRDILTRLIYAYRNAMSFGIILLLFEIIFGVSIGSLQGYLGGSFDILVQRLVEILASIPFLYLILIMGSFFGRSFVILVLTYGALSWIGISYYMRGEFYKTKSQDFIFAAKSMGVRQTNIIFKHILPNTLTPIITFLPFSLISAISILTSLDFLGYGIAAPSPSLGEMISQGRTRLSAWWLIFFPSTVLFFIILLTAFIGEGLRDAFDEKEELIYE